MKWREGHSSCREKQGGAASSLTNCVMQWSTRQGPASAATAYSDTTTLLLLLQGFGKLLADDARRTPYYLAERFGIGRLAKNEDWQLQEWAIFLYGGELQLLEKNGEKS